MIGFLFRLFRYLENHMTIDFELLRLEFILYHVLKMHCFIFIIYFYNLSFKKNFLGARRIIGNIIQNVRLE